MITIPVDGHPDLQFTDKQAHVINVRNREDPYHIILEGAVRSGKTHLNNLFWIAHIGRFPPPQKNFILTGNTIGAIHRNVISPLAEFMRREITLDTFNRFRIGPHLINCFGSDRETSYRAMQGMTAFGWYANEISVHHANTIQEAFQRCSGEGARIFWDCNPDNPNHSVKVDYIDQNGLRDPDGKLVISSHHFVLDDNEFLTKEYVANVKRTTPAGMWYDRRILGLWVAAEGIIFTNWKEIDEIPDEVKKHSRRFYGLDFGFSVDPAVLIDVYFNGDEIWVDELIYSTDYTNYMLAADMEKFCDRDVQIYADSAEPKSIEEIFSFGFNIHGATKGPDSVRVGIDWMLGKRIYVTSKSKNIINELQNYAWKVNKDGAKLPVPIDTYNDAIDSIRYASSEFIDVFKGRISDVGADELGL